MTLKNDSHITPHGAGSIALQGSPCHLYMARCGAGGIARRGVPWWGGVGSFREGLTCGYPEPQ